MAYFRSEGILTKKYLISLIRGKPKYLEYLPDNVELEGLTKDLLFSVSILFIFQLIAHIEPELYANLYDLYKKKTAENVMRKWEDYALEVPADVINEIKNYQPVKK